MKKEAMLYQKKENGDVHCRLCAHYCKIANTEKGFCGVRYNLNGTLYTMTYGKTIARHIDPIEKKPLYHFLPGSRSYSMAAAGCNFRCDFCQNWEISQIKSSDQGGEPDLPGLPLTPEEIVNEATENQCESISYTYTEPTIFFEYAYEVARLAKNAGLGNVFVTNGYMTREALDTLSPYLDAANVDLKAWRDSYYKEHCQSHVKPVLRTIRHMKESNIWVEVTTLVIPGENDSREDLEAIARFISEVGKDIPWHISRFHPDYRFTSQSPTPVETLRMAREIGKKAGLRYVYLGNVAGDNNTYCPQCAKPVVQRPVGIGGKISIRDGKCVSCGEEIEGVWG